MMEYNEEEIKQAYICSYWTWYLTDFEQKCRHSGNMHEKAKDSDHSFFKPRADAEWAAAPESMRAALAPGYEAFTDKLKTRVVDEFCNGTILLNRCPACRKIVRTPRAQQCLWCGHDWHGKIPDQAEIHDVNK